jgi:glycosyltransferase involved in cell wall biosynthesis
MARRATSDRHPACSSDRREPSLVSVVIPALNAAATLDEQLAALSVQSYGAPWEVVVADNGSTDGTAETARAWSRRLPSLLVVDASAKRGAAYARNAGARAARGDLLAFCDADDVVDQGWLTALVEALRSSDIAAGVVGSTASLPVYMDFLPRASTGCMALWRDAFEQLGGFDTVFLCAEDVEFSWRAQLAGYRLSPAPEARILRGQRKHAAGVAAQFFSYGQWSAYLFKQYRAYGVPHRGPWKLLRRLGWLAIRVPYLASTTRRRIWIRLAAKTAGALVGSFRHRVLYVP